MADADNRDDGVQSNFAPQAVTRIALSSEPQGRSIARKLLHYAGPKFDQLSIPYSMHLRAYGGVYKHQMRCGVDEDALTLQTVHEKCSVWTGH